MDTAVGFSLIVHVAENVYITGSVDALSDWSTSSALIMGTADYPTWSSE